MTSAWVCFFCVVQRWIEKLQVTVFYCSDFERSMNKSMDWIKRNDKIVLELFVMYTDIQMLCSLVYRQLELKRFYSKRSIHIQNDNLTSMCSFRISIALYVPFFFWQIFSILSHCIRANNKWISTVEMTSLFKNFISLYLYQCCLYANIENAFIQIFVYISIKKKEKKLKTDKISKKTSFLLLCSCVKCVLMRDDFFLILNINNNKLEMYAVKTQ